MLLQTDVAEEIYTAANSNMGAADEANVRVVIGVPCNTFHAPPIWNKFKNSVQDLSPDITVINMLEETAAHIAATVPGARKLGLMSTTGTRTVAV